ncbi:hypothetical protein QTO34_011137 [Cnephaeus nilssonii]|uniref:Tetraspanin-2 n=1 Tax=Cnephaeus nilssonii TaxID=3371016 RepID=A0AA40LE88_CNENI|nr:hypothetical protein QTO34_011137 [Eptesicus nilssonii]
MGRFRGGLRCIKYLLLGFNLLFWLAGSAVIAFGLWFRFGGTMKDLSSGDKSPEYFYVAPASRAHWRWAESWAQSTQRFAQERPQGLEPLGPHQGVLLVSLGIFNSSVLPAATGAVAAGPCREHVLQGARAGISTPPLPTGLYVLVGAGALMMAVGFFGCCGAMRESQCVLGSFFTCLLVIFAAEVTTGVFAFIGKDVAIRHVQTMYEEAYNDYLKDRGRGNGTLITFHSAFQCCGKESSEPVQPTCPKELLGHKNCIDEIETIISVKLQLIGIVGIGIAGLTVRKVSSVVINSVSFGIALSGFSF